MNKCLCLAAALSVTKFKTVIATNLLTLWLLRKSDLDSSVAIHAKVKNTPAYCNERNIISKV
jgi:hypothetical protein